MPLIKPQQAWWEGDWWNRPLFPPVIETISKPNINTKEGATAKPPSKPAIAPNPAKATKVPPSR